MSDHDELVHHADNAYEAIRALNHRTRGAMPAPLVYDLLGNLNNLGYGLNQLLGQISDGLIRSLTEYDVYDRNRHPAESVAIANKAMGRAARHAHEIGEQLADLVGMSCGPAHGLVGDGDGFGRVAVAVVYVVFGQRADQAVADLSE